MSVVIIQSSKNNYQSYGRTRSKKTKPMIESVIGTCHFVSINAAVIYYKPYGYTKEDVQDKMKDQSIVCGVPPKLNRGESCRVNKEGRYEILKPY